MINIQYTDHDHIYRVGEKVTAFGDTGTIIVTYLTGALIQFDGRGYSEGVSWSRISPLKRKVEFK